MECIEEHELLLSLAELEKFNNSVLMVSFQDNVNSSIDFLNNYGYGNIIYAVDEEVRTLNCKKNSKRGCNNKSTKCITHNLWDQLDQHINGFFDKVRLHDLTKQQQKF